MNILLLGKNGQLGWELQRALSILGQVTALDRSINQGLCGDLSNLEGLSNTIELVKPDVIVNAAAYTAVDKAESERELANLINEKAVALMATKAKQLGALLVHYSTDYVFNGTGDKPWCENDDTAPLSQYGKSKLAGEQAILHSGCMHLIFRTSWVYASKGNNFAKTMLKLAQQKESLNIISDQIGSPTSAELLADVTAHVIPKVLGDHSKVGVYHLAASGYTSWYNYAKLVFDIAKKNGMDLMINEVNPIPTSEYPTPATRPLNSRLNTNKLTSTFDICMPSWDTGVKRMLNEVIDNE